MAYIIAVLSQKGGVGKSTIARMIATAFAHLDGGSWKVEIADMDISQGTSLHWTKRRNDNCIAPAVPVKSYGRVEAAIAASDTLHVMVIDGAPHASRDTLKIALASDVVILPTGTALDDLEPSVALARELQTHGVASGSIVFGLSRTGHSEIENAEARDYLTQTGFRVASGSLPDRTAYRRSSDKGKAVTETSHNSLNATAKEFKVSLMQQLYQNQQAKENVA